MYRRIPKIHPLFGMLTLDKSGEGAYMPDRGVFPRQIYLCKKFTKNWRGGGGLYAEGGVFAGFHSTALLY